MVGQQHDGATQEDLAEAKLPEAGAPISDLFRAYWHNASTYTGLALAVCGGAPLAHFYGWFWALWFIVAAITGLLVLVYYSVRVGVGDDSAAPLASTALSVLVTIWMMNATALFVTGDRAAWIYAVTIPTSWTLHIIFSPRASATSMKIGLGIATLPLVGFLLYGAWSEFTWWVAVPATVSALAMLPSVLASADWSRRSLSQVQRARDEAQAAKHRLEFAIDSAGDGYFEVDLESGAYRPNAALLNSLGVRGAAPTVEGMRAGLHPEDAEIAFAKLDRMKRDELLGWDQDLRVMAADGEYRWVQMRARLLETDEERTLLGTMTDLRERKAMEEELRASKERAEASSKAKSEFLANMSHEIRTPLNGVLGMAQSLELDDLTDEQRKKVAIILDSGKALTGVLNDVLDLSKIEAGKLDISPVPGDLLHTMKRVRQLFQTTAEDKGLVLSARHSPDFPTRLSYDPVRVRQCVSNLLSNAVKFTSQGKIDLAISSEEIGDNACMVKIEVIDTGIGMTQDVQDKLFAAFTQADGAITRSFGGTGLGLAISRQLARMMDGDITVTSVPGVGSTFTLTFKAELAEVEITTKREETKPTEQGGSTSMRGKRVLLTDDNAVNRQVIKLFMAPMGCVVVEATNGKEALDALATESFDIVLLDVHMPVMDGTEAIRRIRGGPAEWKDIPVIALTADAMSGDRERYLAMGMTDYLSKPVDQRELSSKMHAVLNLAAPAEAGRKTG